MFLSFCEFDKDGISGLEEEAVAWDVDGWEVESDSSREEPSLSLYDETLVFGQARKILSSWRLIESDTLPDGDDASQRGVP